MRFCTRIPAFAVVPFFFLFDDGKRFVTLQVANGLNQMIRSQCSARWSPRSYLLTKSVWEQEGIDWYFKWYFKFNGWFRSFLRLELSIQPHFTS
ncbi:MAG TPA: hypothetical protein DD635_09350 [Flavobacteriales bacterium]|nr:hypothetical protein [Flavobacteriales bacterium]